MKDILLKQILWVLTFSTFLTSCKKVLEQPPRNAPYDEVFWKTARDCRSALAGNYALLRDAFTDKENRYYMYGDAIAKNYFTIKYTGDGLENIQNGDFTFQYNVESLGDWRKYFKTIAMSNLILKKLPGISDAQLTSDVDNPAAFRNNIMGQAYFIRALTYFAMTRVWGEVPIANEVYEDVLTAPNIARSPIPDVLNQIEKDCNEAVKLLDWKYDDIANVKVTANKGAAYALLAHFYLWRATMLNISNNTPNLTDVGNAEAAITQIMTNGGYVFTDTANYYTTFIEKSPESIFEIAMNDDNLEGSASHIGSRFLDDADIANIGSYHRFFVVPSYLQNHYYENDPDIRYQKNFTFRNASEPICRKYHNVSYRNKAQKLDPYLSNNMIIFRLSDMKLLQAEIAIYKNNFAGARDIINWFRIKNGTLSDNYLPDDLTGWSKEDMLYEYVLERGKELYLEGHIFYDLLRTRMYKYLIDWLPEDEVRFKQGGFYWPVNPALFKNNSLLKQTTYWVGKI